MHLGKSQIVAEGVWNHKKSISRHPLVGCLGWLHGIPTREVSSPSICSTNILDPQTCAIYFLLFLTWEKPHVNYSVSYIWSIYYAQDSSSSLRMNFNSYVIVSDWLLSVSQKWLCRFDMATSFMREPNYITCMNKGKVRHLVISPALLQFEVHRIELVRTGSKLFASFRSTWKSHPYWLCKKNIRWDHWRFSQVLLP